ncbi:MAG: hypothetical protein P0Y49_17980 [Candidatus Pedobacter colombiensis]|uniref:Lipoprotein n=1 Tax=Candidatus Pedobacter colombiensis TaxID=3121371 RepID=A0AAJ6B6A0_9SPHI|nr:hypothetical protein [Pedobacter sp.]WEK18679.1 MAG: hypothetical protein P0Y49_17980 [Pedobacter sp.]
MISTKYSLKIVLALILFIASCHIENPYTKEKVIFNIPEQEVIKNLHKEFQFEKVSFSGISIDLIKNRVQSAAYGKRIDFQINILNPKIDKNELAFAQEFAKRLKPYVKNIDHFNVITIDTKIKTKYSWGSTESNKRTLLYAGSLLEFPIENYFTTTPDYN